MECFIKLEIEIGLQQIELFVCWNTILNPLPHYQAAGPTIRPSREALHANNNIVENENVLISTPGRSQ